MVAIIRHAMPWMQASYLPVLIHIVIVVVVFTRIVMARPAPGVALAWLLVVALLPAVGIVLYVLFGERRVGRRRAERYAKVRTTYGAWIKAVLKQGVTEVDWSRHLPACERMDRLGLATIGVPTLMGNDMELISDTQEILQSIVRDVDAAKSTVQMEFYIWFQGGTADEVVEALLRAAGRGVRCRVLVDALGSAKWWRSKQRKRLQATEGIEVVRAMPVSLWRSLFARGDLRLHRKIVVIDGELAYTGSMNLVDPRFFKQESGVGQWVDAMARVRGPAVEGLLGVFLSDWKLETGEDIEQLLKTSDMKHVPPQGESDIQVFPSGPQEGTTDAILQMLLKMFYAARREIIITTPYFVPDDSMLRALRSAAAHGVRVELILPAKVDSLLVRYASRSYYDDLTESGVNIQQFSGGLLHTKSITVDGRISMFGTLNLDMRSLWLNYEVSLFVYDRDFGEKLRELQLQYLKDSTPVDRKQWLARPPQTRFVENTARLVSPLL